MIKERDWDREYDHYWNAVQLEDLMGRDLTDSIERLKQSVDAALDIRLRAQLKRVDVLVSLADVTLSNLSRRLYALEYFPHKEGTINDQPAYSPV